MRGANLDFGGSLLVSDIVKIIAEFLLVSKNVSGNLKINQLGWDVLFHWISSSFFFI